MKSNELRQKYLEFFASRGHAVIPSASLIPENDATVLFTTAGMHPLVPFLLGEKHPAGTKLTSCQKCIRTGDIDEVGDATHLTFFEMLGNWSLGSYWKKEALEMSFEFLTKILEFPLEKLAVSVFAGDETALFDEKSFEIWKNLGVPESRIARLPKSENWWGPAGASGPCGPDSEMFFWNSDEPPPEKFDPENSNWVEIWNDVFMEYEKTTDGKFVPLKQKNVDTGLGLDRVAAILQKKATVFETDLFTPIIEKVRELSEGNKSEGEVTQPRFQKGVVRSERIIADHIRAATFIIGDERGVPPSNVDAGYIVRRLIRRAIREARKLGFDFSQTFTTQIAEVVIEISGKNYPELVQNSAKILLEFEKEEKQFKKTLEKGLKELTEISQELWDEVDNFGNIIKKGNRIDGKILFNLFSTYGFPFEMSIEEINNLRKSLRTGGEGDHPEDLTQEEISELKKEFDTKEKRHQELSRTASAGKFAGGLADDSEVVARLHTATHLLHAALRQVLGEEVSQRGSNITAERLRFDFNYSEKMTPEQKEEVEKIVNEMIKKDLPVECEEMTVDEAKAAGAIGVFDSKYGEKVKVFSVGNVSTGSTSSPPPFSREICGGPHAKKTGELGRFKIKKEESSSAGVRRIKAVLVKD